MEVKIKISFSEDEKFLNRIFNKKPLQFWSLNSSMRILLNAYNSSSWSLVIYRLYDIHVIYGLVVCWAHKACNTCSNTGFAPTLYFIRIWKTSNETLQIFLSLFFLINGVRSCSTLTLYWVRSWKWNSLFKKLYWEINPL